jgi:type IV pilus assembly protein PilA
MTPKLNVQRQRLLIGPNRQLKSHPQGFTLLELLVVIVILGILSAIAFPWFLRQANRAREAEAKTYVGTINRAQQAYFMQNWRFTSLATLEIGISNSASYSYESNPSNNGGQVTALTTATPISGARGYAGKVWLAPGLDGNINSFAIVCEGREQALPSIPGTTCPP